MKVELELTRANIQLDNEAELIILAKTDDQAFERLYNYYFPKVYGYIFKRIGQKETTEDIVSTIFLKIFTNLDTYQVGKFKHSFCAWIFRVATNALIDHYRSSNCHKANVNIEDIVEPADHRQDSFTVVALSQDRAVVHRLIADLPVQYQKVIQLKYFAELSNLEIAEVMEISVSNTGVLLHRALKKFQELHQKYV